MLISENLRLYAGLRDTGAEAFYHGFLLGLLVLAKAGKKNNYRIIASNREAGDGFSDITLIDRRLGIGAILEFKKTSSEREMAKACDEALTQIQKKRYAEQLEGSLSTMRRYGIAFHGKYCLVKMQQ